MSPCTCPSKCAEHAKPQHERRVSERWPLQDERTMTMTMTTMMVVMLTVTRMARTVEAGKALSSSLASHQQGVVVQVVAQVLDQAVMMMTRMTLMRSLPRRGSGPK